jgi:hypothetical protein
MILEILRPGPGGTCSLVELRASVVGVEMNKGAVVAVLLVLFAGTPDGSLLRVSTHAAPHKPTRNAIWCRTRMKSTNASTPLCNTLSTPMEWQSTIESSEPSSRTLRWALS